MYRIYLISIITVISLLLVGCGGSNENITTNDKSNFYLTSKQIETLILNKTMSGKFINNSKFTEYFEQTFNENKEYKLTINYDESLSKENFVKTGDWFIVGSKLCYMNPQIICEKIFYDGSKYITIRNGKIRSTFLVKESQKE